MAEEIKFIITFEIVGTPKIHVEQSLKDYMRNIKKDARIKFYKEDYAEAIELEDGMFSTFCEAELGVEDLALINWLCVNFSPASIEIMEPVNITFKAHEMTAWFNDLLAKIHEIGTNFRTIDQKNKLLNISMNNIIRNFILTLLEINPKKKELIARLTGINEKQIEPFLKQLIDDKKITEKKGIYSINKGVKRVENEKK